MKPLTRNTLTKNAPRDEKVEQAQRPNEAKPKQAQCCAKISKSVAGCHD